MDQRTQRDTAQPQTRTDQRLGRGGGGLRALAPLKSDSRSTRRLGLGLLGLVLLGQSACAEPVDCASEPGRCLAPAYAPAAPAMLQRPALAKVAEKPAAEPAQAPQAEAAKPLAGAAKRLRALPPTDTLAARSRDGAVAQVRDDAAVAAAAPAERQRAIRVALRELLPAIKAHDFAALKAKASQRFAQNIPDIEAKYAERFWRHADKYVPVLSGPPPTIELEDQDDGRVQAKITAQDTTELRAMFVQEGGAWKIDRF